MTKLKYNYHTTKNLHKFVEGNSIDTIASDFINSNYNKTKEERIKLAIKRFRYNVNKGNIDGLNIELVYDIDNKIAELITKQDIGGLNGKS